MYKVYSEMAEKQKPEELIIYTEDKKALGTLSKGTYDKIKEITIGGNKIVPWVECVTCFIIDKKTKEVAIQLRGMDEIDPGEFDLCSGHVSAGEINKIAMIREIKEEMLMEGYDNDRLARDFVFCGKVKMDFSKAKSRKGKKIRCFTTAYAIVIDDKDVVSPNQKAVLKVGWMNFDRLKDEIRNSNFRFPYTVENCNQYERVFENVEKVIRRKIKSS